MEEQTKEIKKSQVTLIKLKKQSLPVLSSPLSLSLLWNDWEEMMDFSLQQLHTFAMTMLQSLARAFRGLEFLTVRRCRQWVSIARAQRQKGESEHLSFHHFRSLSLWKFLFLPHIENDLLLRITNVIKKNVAFTSYRDTWNCICAYDMNCTGARGTDRVMRRWEMEREGREECVQHSMNFTQGCSQCNCFSEAYA